MKMLLKLSLLLNVFFILAGSFVCYKKRATLKTLVAKYLAKRLSIKVNVIQDGINAPILAAGKLLSNKKLLSEIVDNF